MKYLQFLKNMNMLTLVKPVKYGVPTVVYLVIRNMQIAAAKGE